MLTWPIANRIGIKHWGPGNVTLIVKAASDKEDGTADKLMPLAAGGPFPPPSYVDALRLVF